MSPPTVRQITHAPHGHILTNVNVWSPDSRRIVYDVRSDVAGGIFDGDRIETVGLATGEVRQLYQSRNRAHCGVVTYHPTQHRVVFILGPEHPTDDFQYGFARRQGVMVDEQHPGLARNLDARDLSSPFTPGALRGGSHVHVFSPDGAAVSFTYEDHVLGAITEETAGREINLRNVGVSLLGAPVTVPPSHPRNHDGESFTVLVSKTVAHPRPGSDDIKKAYEEGWIVRAGLRSLVFLGDTVDDQGRTVPEIFRVDLPADLASPSRRETAVIEGTLTKRPAPPAGVQQRRLTHSRFEQTTGLPRHWLRVSPDGSQVAFLRADEQRDPQLWLLPTDGGEPRQVSRVPGGVRSAFSWSPDGRAIAHLGTDCLALTDVGTGTTRRLVDDGLPIRPEAVVFSPDGGQVAFVRTVNGFNQIFVVDARE